MEACCLCHACRCPCHKAWSPTETHRMVQEVLHGARVVDVAQRYQVSAPKVRLWVMEACHAANPARYAVAQRAGGKVLDELRVYAEDYGFRVAPKYAQRRRARVEPT